MADKANSNAEFAGSKVLDYSQEDANRIDMQKMTPEEIFEECLRWRLMAPYIAKITNTLKGFQQFAKSGEELQDKIGTLVKSYEGAIQARNEQIKMLGEMFEQATGHDPTLPIQDKPKDKSKLH